jgi:hypothetical protein
VDPSGFQRLLQESLAWPPPMDVWQMIAAVSPMDLCGMAMHGIFGPFCVGGCFNVRWKEQELFSYPFQRKRYPRMGF